MTSEIRRKIEQAVASRNPISLADIIQAIPVLLTIFDRIWPKPKAEIKRQQLMNLINNATNTTPIHMLKDAAKIINES